MDKENLTKWIKINQLETEINELSVKQENLRKKLRGLIRLMKGKNYHIIKGIKQDRLKIIWLGKDYWYHLPKQKSGEIDGDYIEKIISKFIDNILNGSVK